MSNKLVLDLQATFKPFIINQCTLLLREKYDALVTPPVRSFLRAMEELDGFEDHANRLISDILPSVQLEFGKLYVSGEVKHDQLNVMYLKISGHNNQRPSTVPVYYKWYTRQYRFKPSREVKDELNNEKEDDIESEHWSKHDNESNDESDDNFAALYGTSKLPLKYL